MPIVRCWSFARLMQNKPVTVNSLAYDGTVRRSWQCELVERNDPLFVFVGTFDRDVEHRELGNIKKGTISYEYYWLDRWYNIFRFHEANGTLRNYYCNINMPPTFVDGELNYIDLDIDIVVWPDMSYQVLDQDEFETSAALFNYSEYICRMVETTAAELISIVERGDLPTFDGSYATNL